jgi:hypothetical protein
MPYPEYIRFYGYITLVICVLPLILEFVLVAFEIAPRLEEFGRVGFEIAPFMDFSLHAGKTSATGAILRCLLKRKM